MTAPVRQSVPQLTGAELERRKRDEKDMNRTRATGAGGRPIKGHLPQQSKAISAF
jgi:hypothetical protein